MNFLELVFKADSSELKEAKKALAELGKEANSTAVNINDLSSSFGKLLGPIGLAVTAITAATGALTAMALKTIDAADHLDELSQATGIASENLQAYEQIAKKNGGTLEGLVGTFNKVAMGMSKTNDENSKFSKALEYMGVSATDSNGKLKDSAQLTQELADYWMKSTKNASDQAAMMVTLGKGYKDNVVAAEALKTTQEELNRAKEIGADIDGNLKKASSDYNDELIDTKLIFEALGNQVARELLPMFSYLTQAFMDSYKNGGLVRDAFDLVVGAAARLGEMIKFVSIIFIGLDAVVQGVGKTIGALAAAFIMLQNGDWSGVSNVWKMWKSDLDDIAAKADAAIKKVAALKALDKGTEAPAPGAANPRTLRLGKEGNNGSDIYKAELDNLNKEIAKLQGVGELEAYIAKLDETKYNKLLPWQKQDLINHEAKIIKLQQEKIARELMLKSDTEMMLAQQKQIDVVNDYSQSLRESVKQRQFELGLIGKTPEEINKITVAHQMDLDLQKQIAKIEADAGDQDSADTVRRIDNMRKENEEAKKKIGIIQDQADQAKKIWDEVNSLTTKFIDGFSQAFVDMVTTGKNSFKDLIATLLKELAKFILSSMFQTFLKAAGGTTGIWTSILGMFASNGAGFNAGGTRAFASGGVVGSPTGFAYGGGLGVMGESGPEAILPLARGSRGQLGVQVTNGGMGGGVVQNNSISITVQGGKTNDETGSVVSKAVLQTMRQIAKDEINTSRRPGGMLNPMAVA
jgi:hypothetical protein